MTLQTYGQFRPTAFDRAGAFLDDDRQAWIVAPCSQTRDSIPMEQSNFAACLEILGGESETVEIHRFGHWGPGWYELILVSPERASEVEAIAERLESYPLLDEEDASSREWDAYLEAWKLWGARDFVRFAGKSGLSDRAVDLLDSADTEDLRALFESGVKSGEYYTHEGPRVESCKLSRPAMAAFLRKLRASRLRSADICPACALPWQDHGETC